MYLFLCILKINLMKAYFAWKNPIDLLISCQYLVCKLFYSFVFQLVRILRNEAHNTMQCGSAVWSEILF